MKIKYDDKAGSSRSKSKKRQRPNMNIVYAWSLYRNNVSVEVNDVHLSGVWLLNAGRVSVQPVPRTDWERHEEILHRCEVLP
jgi:hypothetical protein